MFPRKSLIVFKNSPTIRSNDLVLFDQNLEAKNAPRQNISFNWMGANYLMENNEEHHHDLGGNKGSERKMFETGCNARKDSNEDSNGITLNQGLKQFVVSPTNASYSCNADSHLVEHNFMHEKENKATCFESTSHNEEFDSAPELASIQSEFEAVLNASQVEVDLPLSSELHNKGYKRSENGLSVHCSDISNLNKFEGRNLVVEPLCKPRSGKCDILAFVLQVNAEKIVKLKNGGIAKFSTIYICDADSDYVKLTLWHGSRNWAERLEPGCIIAATGVIQNKWREQISLATTATSELIDVQMITEGAKCTRWTPIIDRETLNNFIACMKTKHPLIWKNFAMMPSLRKAVDVECFDDLVHGTIVSVVALVESICTKQDSVGAMQQSAVLVWLQDKTGRKIRLSVWANQSSVLPILRKNQRKWLKFTKLAVRISSAGADLEAYLLSDTNVRPIAQQKTQFVSQEKRDCAESVEVIKGSVESLEFQNDANGCFVLSKKLLDDAKRGSLKCTSLESYIQCGLSGLKDALYTACGNCLFELEPCKGEFEACKRCIDTYWGYDFKKLELLRPFKIHIKTDGSLLAIAVFPFEFHLLKTKAPLKDIFQICRTAKDDLGNDLFPIMNMIDVVLTPKDFAFHVSRQEAGSSGAFTFEEIYLLKDVEKL